MTRSIQGIYEMRNWVQEQRSGGQEVGLVPTMGAYHPGHRALMSCSVAERDLTVVSRYVNPTQFDSEENAESYPDTRDEDLTVLREESVDVVFEPSTEEMYSKNESTRILVDAEFTDEFEGEYRDQFFPGVARVVSKLLNIVSSDVVYFGEKDLQQLLMVRHMIQDLHFPQSIRTVPVERDDHGVAYSSRNRWFRDRDYETAITVRDLMIRIKKKVDEIDRSKLSEFRSQFREQGINLDYLDVVDYPTFERTKPSNPRSILIVAGYIGDVRLKDNCPLHANSIRDLEKRENISP